MIYDLPLFFVSLLDKFLILLLPTNLFFDLELAFFIFLFPEFSDLFP